VKLMDMGFSSRVACEDALREAKGDFNAAVELLFG
jgi:translation elongation factor EF-Ts